MFLTVCPTLFDPKEHPQSTSHLRCFQPMYLKCVKALFLNFNGCVERNKRFVKNIMTQSIIDMNTYIYLLIICIKLILCIIMYTMLGRERNYSEFELRFCRIYKKYCHSTNIMINRLTDEQFVTFSFILNYKRILLSFKLFAFD